MEEQKVADELGRTELMLTSSSQSKEAVKEAVQPRTYCFILCCGTW